MSRGLSFLSIALLCASIVSPCSSFDVSLNGRRFASAARRRATSPSFPPQRTSLSTSSARFVALGDWGGQSSPPFTTKGQVLTSQAMASVSSTFSPHFVWALGDNFYEAGVWTEYSPRFKYTFEDVYSAASLQVPWFVIVGNHDAKGSLDAQIDYSQRSKRWNFPALYRSRVVTFGAARANHTVEFVVLDTVSLVGDWPDDEPAPLGAVDSAVADAQWAFVSSAIANSTADWLFVVGHYATFSVAEHGPTPYLVQQLKPLLEKYGGHYMNGHDHSLQDIDVNGVAYLTVGAGHECDASQAHVNDVPVGSLKFMYPNSSVNAVVNVGKQHDHCGGFATIELFNATTMQLTYYDESANRLHTRFVANRRANATRTNGRTDAGA